MKRDQSCFFRTTFCTHLLSAFLAIGGASMALPARSSAQEPTAAEMSRKETVATALLRNLQFQEYELRSAAEAMPEEKYLIVLQKVNSKTKNRNSAQRKCVLLPSR
jgi:hypothetical protein